MAFLVFSDDADIPNISTKIDDNHDYDSSDKGNTTQLADISTNLKVTQNSLKLDLSKSEKVPCELDNGKLADLSVAEKLVELPLHEKSLEIPVNLSDLSADIERPISPSKRTLLGTPITASSSSNNPEELLISNQNKENWDDEQKCYSTDRKPKKHRLTKIQRFPLADITTSYRTRILKVVSEASPAGLQTNTTTSNETTVKSSVLSKLTATSVEQSSSKAPVASKLQCEQKTDPKTDIKVSADSKKNADKKKNILMMR